MGREGRVAVFVLVAAAAVGAGAGGLLLAGERGGEPSRPAGSARRRSDSPRLAASAVASSAVAPRRSASGSPGAAPAGEAAAAPDGRSALSVGAVASSAYVWIDDEHEPPPYPWDETAPDSPAERLDARRMDLDLSDAPVRVALGSIAEVASLSFVVDPSLDAALRDARISLRLRDISARNALLLVLANLPEEPTYAIEGGQVALRPLDASREHGTGAPGAPDPPLVASRLFEYTPHKWSALDRRHLESAVTFHFEETPLSEVAAFLQDFAELPIVLARSLDAEKLTFTWRAADVTVKDVLDRVCRDLDLVWRAERRGARIMPRDEATGDERTREESWLCEKRLTLDLRATSVPALVAELGRLGIETIPSRRAWESRGTLSVVARDESLADVFARFPRRTGLVAWIERLPGASEREVVLLDGEIPSVRQALQGDALRGDALRGAALRGELVAALESRASLRADLEPARARARARSPHMRAERVERCALDALGDSERAVQESARAVLALIAETRRAATAPALLPGLETEIAAARADTERALAADSAARDAAKDAERVALPGGLAAAQEEVGRAAARLSVARRRLDGLEKAARELRGGDE